MWNCLRLLAIGMMVALASGPAWAATVYADSYGYNTTDATTALQSAINSGADTVIVRNMGSPWYVRPIYLASNQHIIFNDGVVVQAKSGSFTGTHDCLFSASAKTNITLDGYGATFRMNKADYIPYGGEWRHGINVLSSSNVSINGLRIENTGGDGIYLGKTGTTLYNSNITVKDVVSAGNYRQGLSIISVDGLLVQNSQFINTSGTAPSAGMDFEPNGATQRLANINVRGTTISGNDGWGILVWAYYMKNTSTPISMTITNSTIVSDGVCVYDRSSGAAPRTDAPTGNIYLRGVDITGSYSIQAGMQINVFRVHAADANADDMVDVGDMGILATNYGRTGATWSAGDFNADGVVDVGDLGILASQYGWSGGAGGAAGIPAAVPEPAGSVVLLVGLFAIRRRRGHRLRRQSRSAYVAYSRPSPTIVR